MKPPQYPESAVIVQRYDDLFTYVRAFASGKLGLLIIIGAPGLQKSRIVRDTVGRSAAWIESNISAFRLYCELYWHCDERIVIDDVDDLYRDRNGIRLLKALCQTDPCKTVAWHTDAKTLVREQIPRSFRTRSRVCIIANDWRTLDVNVAALEDRGHVLIFQPSPLELHRRTAEWFWDQEIFDFIGARLRFIKSPSMRHYLIASEQKDIGVDWQETLLSRWLSGTEREVARLLYDLSYATEEARVREFIRRTDRDRSTYFYHKKKFPKLIAAPPIPLKQTGPTGNERRGDIPIWLNGRFRHPGNG